MVAGCATLALAVGVPVALTLLGFDGEKVLFLAAIVSGTGGALVRRLLGAEPFAIAVPVAHPRAVALAVTGAASMAIGLGTLLAGGSPFRSAFLGLAGVGVVGPLVDALFFEPVPEPEDEPFQIDPGEIERAKYESMRLMLPRGM
jgi:hypothetical protein